MPITRLSDLSPLDRLGLPVFSATTPLALDLTTHLGKGRDAEHAQLSALMEAVERVSAESVSRPVRRRTFREMSAEVPTLDPRLCDLPDDSSFRQDRLLSWTEGYDLVRGEAIWIAADLVVSPPREGVLRHVDSNGLASGNTMLEAVVHAISEVIERDALGQHLFRSLFAEDGDPPEARLIAAASMPDECRDWRERMAAHGLTLETTLLESDVRVPVFRTVLADDDHRRAPARRRRRFVGLGASPHAAVAAIRSMAEAVQSRTAIVQGARDSFNAVGVDPGARAARGWRRSSTAVPLQFDAVPSFCTSDLREDLQYLLDKVQAAGFGQVIAVNLTRPDLDIPVVRIRIPGMTSFAVNRRRVGWRCLRHLL